MRVPLSWLREFVDFDLDPEALAERLTLLGMEVQRVERRGEEWRSVVVGELLEVARHPSADRLSLTKVTVGDGSGVLSIVCGATNIAPGQRVPVALPGAVLPGEREIGVSRIAGAESQGMLCSGDELRLTSDADGILILPPESPLGRPLAELYGDVILDVDVKPNRGDALSLLGLAREVAAATGGQVRPPDTSVAETGEGTAERVIVEVREPRLCPRFVARYVDPVRVAPSPTWVQMRLLAAGLRPVSNVVDASNYVMLELGKPTHTFDAARVAEGRLVVRLAESGERLETLDHVLRDLSPETLLIADPRGPLAIAGIMGGAASEVGEGTESVIIESAIFDPVTIRRTAQRYGLRSEASLRFEKGQEWRLARLGADRLARLISEWAGGRAAPGTVDTGAGIEPDPIRVAFRPARVNRLLGASLAPEEMTRLLERVEVRTEADATATAPDGSLVAVVPAHRRDLVIEADIAEEIARVRGYEAVPATRPDTPMPPYRPDPRRLVDEIRDLLSGQGLSEVVTHALVGPDDHALLRLDPGDGRTIRVTNPVSTDHSELRRSLLPGMARVLVENERQRRTDLAVFELGAVHEWRGSAPREESRLAILLAGEWVPGAWDAPSRVGDLGTLKGLVAWLGARLRLPALRFEATPVTDGIEHPGRTARIVARDGERHALGRLGELDPRYLAALESRVEQVAYAELDVGALAALRPARLRVVPLPRVPAVERDLAVVVAEARPASDIEEVIREAGGILLRDVRLFDRYQGPTIGDDEVSLGYRLRIQDPRRTLTDDEVDALLAGIVDALRTRVGARIRG